jgi:outer membrane protein assembly factor BamB
MEAGMTARHGISGFVFLLAVAACGSSTTTTQHTKAKGGGDKGGQAGPAGDIVTKQIVEMNSKKFGRPPTEFQAGHPEKIEGPKAAKTPTGFQVQFASQTTITTPTVYDRQVIVSGGFGSRELYAFEKKSGKQQWAINLNDDGPSSAACESRVCVVNTESCTIFAIASDTGKPLWSYYLGDPLTSAPTIADGRVFASYPAAGRAEGGEMPPGATHALAAFDLQTGKILWQVWLDADVMSAPVAVEDFVYVTTFAGTTIKLEQATGIVRYAMRAKATSAPVVMFADDGVEQMYYTRRGDDAEESDGAQEMIIRADHNEPETKYKAAQKKADYVDEKVQGQSAQAAKAATEDAGNGFAGGAPASSSYQSASGLVGAKNVSSMQSFQGSRGVKMLDRNINTMGDEVIATDSENGSTLWSYKLSGDLAQEGGALGTAPLATKNAILFGTLEGDVVRLDPKSGKKVASYKVGGRVRSQPVVDDGWIYVGTDDGRLVAIDTKDKSITGWTTWGGNAQRTGIAPH